MSRFLLLALLTCGMAAAAPQDASAEASLQSEVRPLLKQYCLLCHSAEKHTGDINLERLTSLKEAAADSRVLQKMAEQLTSGDMPPKGLPQPPANQRARLLEWVNGALRMAAQAHAGDPGPVVLRRLNNAEYTFTVRDLTAVASLDPAKEFPADGAAGEGFTNTGNALVMSPSLITKYLDAGKAIATHAVLLPDGIRFSPGVSRRDWTDEILTKIRAFYQNYTEAGGAETVMQQGLALDKNRGGVLPLRKYLTASLELRSPGGPTVEAVARQNGLTPKYLRILVNLLKDTRPSPVLDHLRASWRSARPSDIDGMLSEVEEWQSSLWKFSAVGHIGKEGGPKAWMEPVEPVADHQEFRLKLAPTADRKDVTVYLAAHDIDGKAPNYVVWREPRLAIAGRPPVLLRDLRPFIDELSAHRTRILGATAKALMAASDAGADRRTLAGKYHVDADALDAWFDFLGVGSVDRFQAGPLQQEDRKDGRLRLCARVGHFPDADAAGEFIRPACARTREHEAAQCRRASFADAEHCRRMAQPRHDHPAGGGHDHARSCGVRHGRHVVAGTAAR